jgi:Bacteriocin-protection, YdeI or OmpD-Associated/Domain of unknown function (DUF1905)
MPPISFEATVTRPEGTGTGTFVVVPVDVRAVFGRARPPVRVTINGHSYRSTIAVYGSQSYVGIAREHRDAAHIAPGDRVTVDVESDYEPRSIEVPEDLAAALAVDAEAGRAFEQMPYTHRLEYVRWLDEAKRPETRARRVAASVERIRASKPAG